MNFISLFQKRVWPGSNFFIEHTGKFFRQGYFIVKFCRCEHDMPWPLEKNNNCGIKWECGIWLFNTYVLPQCLWPTNLAGSWVTVRGCHIYPFITWSCEISCQIKTIVYPLPECLWPASKPGRVVTYLDGILPIKSYDPSVLRSCEITWQFKNIIFPLPQCLCLGPWNSHQ